MGCLSVTCLNLKLASQYYLCKRCSNYFGVTNFIGGIPRAVWAVPIGSLWRSVTGYPYNIRILFPSLTSILRVQPTIETLFSHSNQISTLFEAWKYAWFWFRLNFLRLKYIQLEPTWYFGHFCSEITSKSLKIYIVCTFFNKTFEWSEVLKSKSAIPHLSANQITAWRQLTNQKRVRRMENMPIFKRWAGQLIQMTSWWSWKLIRLTD